MKPSMRLGLPAFLVVAGVVGYELFTGPRMYVQPYIRTYQAQMPPTPQGAVPVTDPLPSLPTTRAAEKLTFPPATPADIQRGKVYYGYWCIACHGPAGDGRGPVGESYIPAPTDLRSSKVQSLSDGQLLRAMLLGVGHEPMLERIVPREPRRDLVYYVRSLGQNQAPATKP